MKENISFLFDLLFLFMLWNEHHEAEDPLNAKALVGKTERTSLI